jgi:hypothetical protein
MGLFSKVTKVFAEREIEFNRLMIHKRIIGLADDLFEYRGEKSHEVFADYVRQTLNLEILTLSEGKDVGPEAYAYKRGRIDALRSLLNLREKNILDKKNAKATKGPEAKRTYIRPPAISAGMSD